MGGNQTKSARQYSSQVPGASKPTHSWRRSSRAVWIPSCTPNLPAKIVPTKIPWLKLSGKFPMDMRIPPRNIKIMLVSNPLKSRILVRRLAVASPCMILSFHPGVACRLASPRNAFIVWVGPRINAPLPNYSLLIKIRICAKTRQLLCRSQGYNGCDCGDTIVWHMTSNSLLCPLLWEAFTPWPQGPQNAWAQFAPQSFEASAHV